MNTVTKQYLDDAYDILYLPNPNPFLAYIDCLDCKGYGKLENIQCKTCYLRYYDHPTRVAYREALAEMYAEGFDMDKLWECRNEIDLQFPELFETTVWNKELSIFLVENR